MNWFGVGVVLVGIACYPAALWVLWRELQEAKRDARIATDRLLAAWREGVNVPPRDAVVSEVEALEEYELPVGDGPLDRVTVEWLGQWEEGPVRAKWEGWIRNRLRAGRTEAQALADAELTLVTASADEDEPAGW